MEDINIEFSLDASVNELYTFNTCSVLGHIFDTFLEV